MNLLFGYYNVWLKGDKLLTSKNHADMQKEHYAMIRIQLEECIDISENQVSSVVWVKNGIRYELISLYKTAPSDVLPEIAEELIKLPQ